MTSTLLIEIAIGIALAFAFIGTWRYFADHERSLAAVTLIIAAVAYPLIGLLSNVPLSSMQYQASVILVFSVLAWLGVSRSYWFLAIGWALHAPWDFLSPFFEDVSHMPHWYAGLCVGFDVSVGVYFSLRAVGLYENKASNAIATS